jgi:predicted nuclease of predicted toxin-antitoxin system
MKILLDESLPRKLRYDFGSDHEIWTVRDKAWLGKKNGELLTLMVNESFEIFVTADQNLTYQQNLETVSLSVFVLCATDNRRETLQQLVPKILALLSNGDFGKVNRIF